MMLDSFDSVNPDEYSRVYTPHRGMRQLAMSIVAI